MRTTPFDNSILLPSCIFLHKTWFLCCAKQYIGVLIPIIFPNCAGRRQKKHSYTICRFLWLVADNTHKCQWVWVRASPYWPLGNGCTCCTSTRMRRRRMQRTINVYFHVLILMKYISLFDCVLKVESIKGNMHSLNRCNTNIVLAKINEHVAGGIHLMSNFPTVSFWAKNINSLISLLFYH